MTDETDVRLTNIAGKVGISAEKLDDLLSAAVKNLQAQGRFDESTGKAAKDALITALESCSQKDEKEFGDE